ncbi:MAG TPA: zinc-binding dehydrogenase [Anaerolineales bacterium]|nr:zinc-binding dehydrogenase [Anaerolineales bacterium]
MKYNSVIVPKRGGPDVLQVVENELREPAAREVRIRVLAAPVCLPDVTARYGQTPFCPNVPFTPGYAVIGLIDATGKDVTCVAPGDRVAALTAFGGYAEYLYWDAERLIPVPNSLDPAKAIPLVLNYIVAYQILHHSAQVKSGDTVLIIGASGGIGTALLQLGKLSGLKMYGIASRSKHSILMEYGAIPIDYRTQDFVEVIGQAEPQGLNAVFDGVGGDYFGRSYSLLRRGGKLIGYGNPQSTAGMLKFLGQVILFSLLPDGKSARPYSTGLSRFNWRLFWTIGPGSSSYLERGRSIQ